MKLSRLYLAIIVIVTLVFWILLNVYNYDLSKWTLPLLAGGLIFPGIPHGALDHKITQKIRNSSRDKFIFFVTYLALMAIVGFIWIIWIDLGVILFIIYSAWHFGETDLISMKIYSPFFAIIFGLGLLCFLLSTHQDEFFNIMDQLGCLTLKCSNSQKSFIPWISFLAMLLPLVKYRKVDFLKWSAIVAVLAISAWLPLLIAFLLYFVGLHSFRGWIDIHDRTGMSNREMMLKAMPLSLGAYVTFLIFWWIWDSGQLDPEHVIAPFFAFLASISLPHIYYMHLLYRYSQ